MTSIKRKCDDIVAQTINKCKRHKIAVFHLFGLKSCKIAEFSDINNEDWPILCNYLNSFAQPRQLQLRGRAIDVTEPSFDNQQLPTPSELRRVRKHVDGFFVDNAVYYARSPLSSIATTIVHELTHVVAQNVFLGPENQLGDAPDEQQARFFHETLAFSVQHLLDCETVEQLTTETILRITKKVVCEYRIDRQKCEHFDRFCNDPLRLLKLAFAHLMTKDKIRIEKLFKNAYEETNCV